MLCHVEDVHELEVGRDRQLLVEVREKNLQNFVAVINIPIIGVQFIGYH